MAKRGERFVLRTNAHVSDDKAVANMGHADSRPDFHSVWWRVAAVVGLSVLVGSGWLLTEAYPSELGFPFAGCIHFAVIGLVAAIFAQWNRWTRDGRTRSRIVSVAVAGLAAFVPPGVAGRLVAGAVSPSANVAIYCALPLIMVLGMAWFGEGSGRAMLMPSLVGLCGALLVFSVELPHSMRQTVGLLAVLVCCAVVAAASVWLFTLLREVRLAAAVAVIGLAGTVTLGSYGLVAGWPRMTLSMVGVEALRCVVFDLPVVWVTVWLMREVRPVRLAARFLIAPVVTWVEGYAMVRGPVEARSIAAFLLMAAGAGMLLLQDELDEVPGLRLR